MEETITPKVTATDATARTETVSRTRRPYNSGTPRLRHADGTFMDADAKAFFLELVEKNKAALADLFPTDAPAPSSPLIAEIERPVRLEGEHTLAWFHRTFDVAFHNAETRVAVKKAIEATVNARNAAAKAAARAAEESNAEYARYDAERKAKLAAEETKHGVRIDTRAGRVVPLPDRSEVPAPDPATAADATVAPAASAPSDTAPNVPASGVAWTTKSARDAKAQEIVRSLWNAGLDMGGTYHFASTRDRGNSFARCDNGVETHVFTNTVRLWVPKSVADADTAARCALALRASGSTVSTYKSGTKVLLTF